MINFIRYTKMEYKFNSINKPVNSEPYFYVYSSLFRNAKQQRLGNETSKARCRRRGSFHGQRLVTPSSVLALPLFPGKKEKVF